MSSPKKRKKAKPFYCVMFPDGEYPQRIVTTKRAALAYAREYGLTEIVKYVPESKR